MDLSASFDTVEVVNVYSYAYDGQQILCYLYQKQAMIRRNNGHWPVMQLYYNL